MSCKSEIVSVFLTTADDIFISDPEAEYYPLVKRLHGQVIKLSPTSRDYVNPLDINLNYSEDDSPLALNRILCCRSVNWSWAAKRVWKRLNAP